MEIAISVRQPWAALIVLGLKDIENRTWEPPACYLGQTINIHAGVQPDRDALEYPRQPIKEAAERLAAYCGVREMYFKHIAYHSPEAFYMGGIVGRAVINSATLNGSISPWASPQPDTWHWHIVVATTSPFAPCKGQLGFFKPTFQGQPSAQSVRLRQGSLFD